MNKKERVLNAIKGEEVDRVPTGFSLHFSEEEYFGQAAVDAHLEFFKETDTDIIKIMNDNLVPCIYDIKVSSDWNQVKNLSMKDKFITRQIELVKRILDKVDYDAFSVGTIHGSVASVLHAIECKYGYEKGRELITSHIREDSKPMFEAFEHITDIMSQLSQKYIELGLDGVYYAALGERQYFTDEEFSNYIAPFEKKILGAVRDKGGYNIFHICKDNLDLNIYKDYEDLIDVLNWGVYEGEVSLEEGRKLFPNTTIMGGLKNRSGVLVEGSYEEIQQQVSSLIKSFGKKKFILGADCTLPSEIPYERIRQVVEATKI